MATTRRRRPVRAANQKSAAAATPGKAPLRKQQFRSATAVIRPTTIPYTFWKEWTRAIGRNDFQLIFDLSAENSPLREEYGDPEEFSERALRRRSSTPGVMPLDLLRIRLEGPDVVHVLQVNLNPDRSERTFLAERWFLIRGEKGLRVFHIDRVDIERGRDPYSVTLADFPAVPAELVALAPKERSWKDILEERAALEASGDDAEDGDSDGSDESEE